jgi:hypothetical protein
VLHDVPVLRRKILVNEQVIHGSRKRRTGPRGPA